MEVTKRETLLECLDMMKKIRNGFSHRGAGLSGIDRYQVLFQEYDEKCRILQDLIQGLESEPVRAALNNWQRLIMENGTENAMMLEKELDNIRHFDLEDYTGNNGPLKGRKDDGRKQMDKG